MMEYVVHQNVRATPTVIQVKYVTMESVSSENAVDRIAIAQMVKSVRISVVYLVNVLKIMIVGYVKSVKTIDVNVLNVVVILTVLVAIFVTKVVV